MKQVKTRLKFRCDFCRYAATRLAVERHEKMCWKNPDRVCEACGNTGTVTRMVLTANLGVAEGGDEPCGYCAMFDASIG